MAVHCSIFSCEIFIASENQTVRQSVKKKPRYTLINISKVGVLYKNANHRNYMQFLLKLHKQTFSYLSAVVLLNLVLISNTKHQLTMY